MVEAVCLMASGAGIPHCRLLLCAAPDRSAGLGQPFLQLIRRTAKVPWHTQ